MPIPEPLHKILESYCHVNATNVELLAIHCKRDDWSYCTPDLFKDQLWSVIQRRSCTVAEYNEVTKEEFDSEEELYDWLVEVWNQTVGEPLNS